MSLLSVENKEGMLTELMQSIFGSLGESMNNNRSVTISWFNEVLHMSRN